MRTHLIVVIAATCAASSVYAQTQPGARARAQRAQAEREDSVPLPKEGESPLAYRTSIAGEDAALFADESLRELQLALTPLRLSQIEGRVASALEYLQTVSEALSATLIRYQRLENQDADSPRLAALRTVATVQRDFHKELITRTNVLLTAAEEKGADVTEQRKYLSAIELLAVPPAPESVQEPTPADLARSTIRDVQEEPPVHERDKPWEVPVSELELELQPLQLEELKVRLDSWVELLQREVRTRVRIDIAVQKTVDQEQKQVLAELAAEQQSVIQSVVEHVTAALALYQQRGGDPSTYSRYIADATGQKIDLSDPAVFYAQARAWLFSRDGGIQMGIRIASFLVILIVFWILSRIIGAIVHAALGRMAQASHLLQDFLGSGSKRIVMLIGVLVAVATLGVNITPLAAAIGAAGLVVGLALQGTLSNFASGVLILLYRPFDVGDVINAGGVLGKVDALSLFSTRVLTFDNQVNLVPNDAIWNNVITNITALDTRRVDLVMGIGYADDMAKAQKIIDEVLAAHPLIFEDPAPIVKVNELADSSVNFIVRPWCKTSDYWDVYWDVTRQVKERFDNEGVNIPFPQRDLHLAGPVEVVVSSERASKKPKSQSSTASATLATTGEPGPADDDGDDN